MSGIGIIETPQSYCAHLYYTRKQIYEWRFYFVITRDLEATNMVVREHYGQFSTLKATWWPRFEHSKITLDIPQEGLVTKEGWRITALTTPTISKEDVDEYKPGQWIPQCELLVQWEREDQRPAHLRHEVDLIGAKPPFNYIRLNLNPAMEEFRLAGGKKMELQGSEQGETSTTQFGVAGGKRMQLEGRLVESTFRLSGDSPLTGELGVERMKRKRLEHGPQFKHHILKGDICFLGDPWQEAATSAGKEISWADIGIKINIPPGAISEDKLITVSVQPCLSGPFELPEDYELASPIYAISPELEFNKDVKLFMAHFADLQNEDDCKNMTFLTTQSSSLPGDSPPYKLIVQENGVFQRGSSVGELSMRHFCRKAVGRRRKQDGKIQRGNAKRSKVTPSRDQEPKLDNKDQQGGAEQSKVTLNGKPHNLYLVQLYQNTGDYPIDNIAAVTVSLHQPVYAMNFKKCLEEWYPSFHFVPSGKVVRFSSRGKASVKFPTDVQGWSIVSDIQPCEIHRVEVDFPILTPHLDYSKAWTYPPKRLLTISPPPAEVGLPHSNDCPLLISGFSEKVQFTLKLRPRPYKPSMMEVQLQQQPVTLPQLIRFKTRSGSINIPEQIGTHHQELGIMLLEDTTGAVTDAIINHSNDATEINLQILKHWVQGKGKKPLEWSTLIEVLNDIGLSELANEIEHALI